ncbi:MAG: carbamoyltransferase HypF [Thermoanaerobaculaceae bacterium]|nr:carbamoyltransferase HypF [Thermoanaerobaculaceae bacterium]
MKNNIVRSRIICEGQVQGVGFRPTVFKLASNLGLVGFIRNSPLGVLIEVEGTKEKIAKFISSLPKSLPPTAKITSLKEKKIKIKGEKHFFILESEEGRRTKALSSPDTKICEECIREMRDERNRRHNYFFTNCTNCGPRFTIIDSFPYDRKRTSMACFKMCKECEKEYKDPIDRRFHAEATCCKQCGPQIFLLDKKGTVIKSNEETIKEAKKHLSKGKIIAIKGIGGFQLAVDAENDGAIKKIRKRKKRGTKPFAVMVKDIETAKMWAFLKKTDISLLNSPQSPIILAPRKKKMSDEIAPKLNDVGIFIPTTPLHIELFRNAPYMSLIMTSGNLSDEPIAISNREAVSRLSTIADYFLVHNRDILRRIDDSVFRNDFEKPFVIRRSRGYVPEAIKIGWRSPKCILGTGAFLQNSCCVLKDDEAFFTPHIGDLDTAKAREFFEEYINSFKQFLDVDFECVSVDLHKDYHSTLFGKDLAKKKRIKLIEIQHHLAHLSSVLEENGSFPKKEGEIAFGIILDGTGMGSDGSAWGGEFFSLSSDLTFKRVSHLKNFPLIGNEKAVKEPLRVAVALLKMENGEDLLHYFFKKKSALKFFENISETTNWGKSSGAGRLFEAAGALSGLAIENRYEGEAAMLFESLASEYKGKCDVWKDVCLENDNLFPTSKFFLSFAQRLIVSKDKAKTAMEFHKNFVRLCCEIASKVFVRKSIVGLSGGCFNNRILRREFKSRLEKIGFHPLLNYNVPSGDGGISFGQVVLASRSLLLQKEIKEL